MVKKANEAAPWPKLKRDCVGRSARVRIRLETRGGKIFDVGSVVKIRSTYRGRFAIEAVEICGLCRLGEQHVAAHVDANYLELLP